MDVGLFCTQGDAAAHAPRIRSRIAPCARPGPKYLDLLWSPYHYRINQVYHRQGWEPDFGIVSTVVPNHASAWRSSGT